ncbi:MAG: cadmium-translocating P-type ATPase [Chloroflexi bacterium]|nr:MAG: cadmium-translocating P-type ATPase [Chloroflexota bacterium]
MAASTQPKLTTAGARLPVALSLWARVRAWFTPLRLEATCVAITFVAMMAGLLTSNMDVNPTVPAIFYLVAYVSGGIFGAQAGIESLRHFQIDVDLLMVLAALGAVVIGSPFEGAMLLFLFSLSNVLQAYALGRTRSAIQALMKLRPEQALVKRDGETMLMPIEQLAIGDRILVRPGERVPLDGIVVEGESTLDQSSLTGESMPVGKRVGDLVFAGTVNQSGSLEVQVTKLARDSTIARLIQMVEEAQSQKAPTERFLDKFEQVYAVGVILFTLLLMIVPPAFFNAPFEASLYRAITVMVVASPCALIISTPAAILSAIANGARRGILFKGGAHLERAGQLDIVAFDKTGTLTVGKPTVTDVMIIPLNAPDCDEQADSAADDPCLPDVPEHIRREQENILLALAAAVESKSEHPLALAIVQTAKHRGLNIPEATDFVNTTGKGVQARVAFMGGLTIAIGNPRYFADYPVAGMTRAMRQVVQLQDEGKTSVLVAKINEGRANILGVIAIADVVRPSALSVIQRLRELGIKRTVMLTGDNERVARAVAQQTGVDEFYADLLPADKVAQIKRLRDGSGKPSTVAMVGDGVNDAPALASASLGIAMGAAGTDVALETADVVLMSDDLRNIPYAIALSRQARRIIIQNLAFAIAVIILLVIAALGFDLPLPTGVVGHEGSTVIVVLNGLRLLRFREQS